MNTPSDVQYYLLNNKEDMKSASGLITDLEIKECKIFVLGNWALVPSLYLYFSKGMGTEDLHWTLPVNGSRDVPSNFSFPLRAKT